MVNFMRRFKTIASLLFAVGLCSFVWNPQTSNAQDTRTVEGVWEIISVNVDSSKTYIGKRISISRKDNGYEVKWLDGRDSVMYSGDKTRIVHTSLDDLADSIPPADTPASVLSQVRGQKVPINSVYTLSADGNYLNRATDYIWVYYGKKSKRFDHYEVESGYIKHTLQRVAVPEKAENRGDRAYKADCGAVNPNRTEPFPPDHEFCPGNLVAMTYFCGGGTGCPYVCCPKGLPYLNHCDCKCYATADFDCHSYSYAREKLLK